MDQAHTLLHTPKKKKKKAGGSYLLYLNADYVHPWHSFCPHHMALYVSTPWTVSLHCLLQSGQEHKVTQFQMSCWTPEGLCTTLPAIMAVIEHVLVIQRRTGNKPIVDHGRWGSWPWHHPYICPCYWLKTHCACAPTTWELCSHFAFVRNSILGPPSSFTLKPPLAILTLNFTHRHFTHLTWSACMYIYFSSGRSCSYSRVGPPGGGCCTVCSHPAPAEVSFSL